jgi:F0F1-type ATP synthase membrane subunit b/b'
MTIWWLGCILGVLAAAAIAFIWVAVRLGSTGGGGRKNAVDDYAKAAEEDVERIFNTEFREELRNRGRLHFEKIISENAMFLQQDLRLTTTQLNEYMKAEMTRNLQEAFNKYEQAISDAKQLAIESIEKTNKAIEEQRTALSRQLQEELDAEKQQLITRLQDNAAEIVSHYLIVAIGDQIDLSDQLEYITSELEANKQAIIDDIERGA